MIYDVLKAHEVLKATDYILSECIEEAPFMLLLAKFV